MIVSFDTNFLSALFLVNAGLQPHQGAVRDLVDRIEKSNGTIIIPMPVWAELCVGLRLNFAPQDCERAMKEIVSSSAFQLAHFDEKSASILVDVVSRAVLAKNKRGGSSSDWQKVIIDRQIVAIAKANGATTLYTADKDQARFADEEFGLKVRDLESLGET